MPKQIPAPIWAVVDEWPTQKSPNGQKYWDDIARVVQQGQPVVLKNVKRQTVVTALKRRGVTLDTVFYSGDLYIRERKKG